MIRFHGSNDGLHWEVLPEMLAKYYRFYRKVIVNPFDFSCKILEIRANFDITELEKVICGIK